MKQLILGSKACGVERMVLLRVRPGADLLAAIEEGIRTHGIRSGIFVSGLGALKKAVLRNLRVFPANYPVRPEDRLYFGVDRPLELLGISGWIGERADGTAEIHAHFSASFVEGERVVGAGGHLTAGTIAGIKVAIAIAVLPPGSVGAAFDEETQSFDIALV